MNLVEKYPDLQLLLDSSFYLGKFFAYPLYSRGSLNVIGLGQGVPQSNAIAKLFQSFGERAYGWKYTCPKQEKGHNFFVDMSLLDHKNTNALKRVLFSGSLNELISTNKHFLSPLYKEDHVKMIRDLEAQLLEIVKESPTTLKLYPQEQPWNNVFRHFRSVREASQEISTITQRIAWLAQAFQVPCDIFGQVGQILGTLKPEVAKVITDDQVKKAVYEYNSFVGAPPYTDAWNYNFVTEAEFDQKRIEDMKEQVMKHCYLIPGFEIIDLRPVQHVYVSDGGFALSSDAFNHPDNPNKVDVYYENGFRSQEPTNHKFTSPVLYDGEAWRIYFKVAGKDPLRKTCFVYFATPGQFAAAYEKARPELVKDFQPWSDLLFISSSWCERNGSRDKEAGNGINLQTPHLKRIALWQWIVGPMISNCRANGIDIQIGVTVNGYSDRLRVEKVSALLQSKGF
jgi:hypothetical protein